MTKYQKFIFKPSGEPEILMAFLSQQGFDSFQIIAGDLHAYIPTDVVGDDFDEAILKQYNAFFKDYRSEPLPDNNWNAIWESGFQPVIVPGFCAIRASFHEPIPAIRHEIVIDPKMAFGTGHHETTYMMIQAMQNISFEGTHVFDYGCGTGVLAILAEKLGAEKIMAIDNDPVAVSNAIENIELNRCHLIEIIEGDISSTREHYDIILANINRTVLLTTLDSMADQLKSLGVLLLSGILIEDIPMISRAVHENALSVNKTFHKGEWACIEIVKNS